MVRVAHATLGICRGWSCCDCFRGNALSARRTGRCRPSARRCIARSEESNDVSADGECAGGAGRGEGKEDTGASFASQGFGELCEARCVWFQGSNSFGSVADARFATVSRCRWWSDQGTNFKRPQDAGAMAAAAKCWWASSERRTGPCRSRSSCNCGKAERRCRCVRGYGEFGGSSNRRGLWCGTRDQCPSAKF